MAEFKINKALTGEISSLDNCGQKVNDGYSSIQTDDVKTLKTSMEIVSQHAAIKKLLDLYQALVLRDAKDLTEMVKEVSKMDEDIAASNGS